MEWGVVVPVKALTSAKSRLDGRTPDERARLALAFVADTVEAARATAGVVSVAVVTADPDVASAIATRVSMVVDEPDGGLNAAVLAGARALRSSRADLGVAAVVGDLPALRADELAAALNEAAAHDRAFVADRRGSGTTLVSAREGAELLALFGESSAREHARAGCAPIGAALESVRSDVDTDQDLAVALRLGVGTCTTATLARPPAGVTPTQPSTS